MKRLFGRVPSAARSCYYVCSNVYEHSVRKFHNSCVHHGTVDHSSRFVVCGAGAGGLAVAARLSRKFGEGNVTVVDPAEVNVVISNNYVAIMHMYIHIPCTHQNHYYQSMWTLVGAGIKTLAQSCRPMESLMPPQAKWIKSAVTEFHPEDNCIVTKEGTKIGYEYLVVAMGLQVNYDKVDSSYHYPHSPYD